MPDSFEGVVDVCQTCLLVAAGYDEHELGYTFTREPLALLNGYVRTPVTDTEGSFSWQDCEGCGDPLGGDRYPLHLVIPTRR